MMLFQAAVDAFEKSEHGVILKRDTRGLGMNGSHAVQTWEWHLR